MKIGPREIVFIVLLMAIPLAAYGFVFKPNDEQNEAMLQQIEVRRAKLNELNRATGTIGDLRKEIASLEKAIDTLQSKLPSEKEMDKVLQEIWQLARRNDLTPLMVKPLNQMRDKPFTEASSVHSEQPVSIVVEGDFMGFYSFLQELEGRPRIMRIHQVSIEKNKKDADGTIRADFVMSIFFEKEDKGSS